MLTKQAARSSIMTQQLAVRNFGVNEKAIKNRMKSVQSIEKITKAMKMVAASKMRGELTRLEAGREYGYNSVDMIFKSDTYLQRKAPAENTDPMELLVPLTSDKGLCGGINSNIVREIKQYVKERNRNKVKIFSVGDKGTVAMVRPFPDLMNTSISNVLMPLNYPTCMAISNIIIEESENCDKIVIIYNEFKSAIS